ncbi:DUF2059 domain-containing protein [Aquimixticola soesokkakensis]|uniref:DUF2059 domain-containing protein n=1 Tax=Aquimixticola soesokkakensis TaxID=1519096 RepID=UPI0013566445|nr:DUF2059 domain-containing protein [Aquimixticola soesokkakensis]
MAVLPAFGATGSAQAASVADLAQAMQLETVIDIMALEGVKYGQDIEDQMFTSGGGAAWDQLVAELYDPERMRATVVAALETSLKAEAIDESVAFFDSALGQKITTLEVSAREAMMDDAVEAAALDSWASRAMQDSRAAQIDTFIEVNDVIDLNVIGALNANYAFYSGMAEGGALGAAVSEDDMLADVWSQEEDVRAETIDWSHAYLSLAYQPLSDDELAQYLAFSQTPAGQKLNLALFAAFDDMYLELSKGLGRGVAIFMAGEDL